jgi:hypothetical protein
VGVDRVLLATDGSPAGSDLFQAVLTMLDPGVALAVVQVPGGDGTNGEGMLHHDRERARQLGRELEIVLPKIVDGPEIVSMARERQIDLIILPLSGETLALDEQTRYVLAHAHCRVLLAATPTVPQEVIDNTPSQVR